MKISPDAVCSFIFRGNYAVGARASARFSGHRSGFPHVSHGADFFTIECASVLRKKIAPPRSFGQRCGLKPALRLHSYGLTVP